MHPKLFARYYQRTTRTCIFLKNHLFLLSIVIDGDAYMSDALLTQVKTNGPSISHNKTLGSRDVHVGNRARFGMAEIAKEGGGVYSMVSCRGLSTS